MPIMGPQIPLKRPGSAFEGSTSEYAISLEDYDDLAPMRPTKIPRTPIGRSEVHQPEWSQGINYSVSPMAIHDLGADLSFGAHDSEPLHPPRAHAQSTATFGCQSVSVPSQLEEQDMVFTDEDIKQLLDEINEEAEKLSERPAQKFSTLQPAHSSEIIDLTDDADDVIDLTGETIGHNRSVVRSTTALSHQPGNKYNSHYGYDQYNAVWPSPGRHAQVNRALFSTPDVMHVSPSQHQDRAQQLRTTAFWRGVQPQYPIPSGIAQYPMRPPPPVITIQDGPDFAEMAEQSRIIDRKEKGGVLNKIGVGDEALLEQMPKAKQPKRIKTEMLPYQLQGLAWLLQKEHPQLPTGNAIEQLFAALPSGGYHNIATNLITLDPPDFASGFVLADDMGLGKTIQIISLICADVEAEKELVPIPYVKTENCDSGTLIIAPVSVMSNWTSQIEQHVDPENRLSVFVYHGQSRGNINLGDYDVVVTSYGTMSSEYSKDENDTSPPKGLFARSWRRVVLDEAHTIRNPNAKCAQAACSLKALSYCSLTGTPIINSPKDLYSLLKFMKYPGGLSDFFTFKATIMRGKGAAPILKDLVSTLCLRRTKDMKFVDLKLPNFTSRIMPVKFTEWERAKYALLEGEAAAIFKTYQSRRAQEGADRAGAYRSLLEILLRLRQCANSTQLCHDRLEAVKRLTGVDKVNLNDPQQKKSLQDLLQLAIDAGEECSSCLQPLSSPNHNPCITTCKHVFGLECLQLVVDSTHKCPVCQRAINDLATGAVGPGESSSLPDTPPKDEDTDQEDTDQEDTDQEDADQEDADQEDADHEDATQDVKQENDLKVAKEEEVKQENGSKAVKQEEIEQGNGSEASSKIKKLILILKSTRNTDPTRKTVVFSQWTTFLTLLEPYLREAGITYSRIDGTMKPDKRDAAIAALHDSSCNVLLASLTVCSVGLNLTMASQCILCDSWWAGAIEQQAIDRVYRLGQKRDVDVFRLVVENSVEQRVLEVQDKKTVLIEEAFQEGGRSRRRERGRTLADIEQLLS